MHADESQPTIPHLYPDYHCDGCGEDRAPSVTPLCYLCDTCGDCCSCYTCDSCNRLRNPDNYLQCSTCDACSTCCTCHHCSGCDENISSDETICELCSQCESCCSSDGECYTCASCDRRRNNRQNSQCSNCDSCERCCECSSCGSCGEISSDSTCGDCNYCHDCCSCGDNSGVLCDGTLTFHKASKTEHKRNSSLRFISLELEVCGDDGNGEEYVKPVAERWDDAIVEDGSLPDSGYEINSNPSSGDVFLDHIGELCSGLQAAGARVDASCGMHCHIAAPDYSYFDLFKLCRLYASIEDGLFELVARSRRNGHRYAERCAARYDFTHYATFKRDLITSLYGEDALTIHCNSYTSKKKPSTSYHRGKNRLSNKTQKYDSARYMALNLHSFFYRGTIEFRHHQGTTNTSKATQWGMVCAAIVDAASRLTITEINALPSEPFERLMAIIPEELQAPCRNRRHELNYR